MRWIAETVRDKSPQQLKRDFDSWALSLSGEVIWRQFPKRLRPRTVRRIVRSLYRASQPDSGWVERWQAEEFPELRGEATLTGPER